MNYIYWNKTVADFIFTSTRAGQEVFLYLTEDDLIQALKKTAGQPNAQLLTTQLAAQEDQVIIADFWQAMKSGPLFWRPTSNHTTQEYWQGGSGAQGRRIRVAPINPAQAAKYAYEDWKRAPLSGQVYGGRKFYYEQGSSTQTVPLHLLYLACFTMPFSMVDAPEQSASYYEIWRKFFLDRGLIRSSSDFPSNTLTELRSAWPSMWEELARWSQQELAGERGTLMARQLGGHAYVGWPQSQCLLPPAVLNRLPRFFAHHNLLPGSRITAVEMHKMLLAGPLPLPAAAHRELQKDSPLGKALTDIVARKLQAWGGNTSYRERKIVVRQGVEQVEEVFHRGITYGTLLPFLPIDLAESETITWSYRLSIRTPLPENLTIAVHGQPSQMVEPASAEWSCELLGILPRTALQEFSDSHNKWILRAKLNPLQVFVPGGRYNFHQQWVPIPTLEQGTELLILCEKHLANDVRQLAQAANSYQDWSNFAGLPATHSLFWLSNLPRNTTALAGVQVPTETYIRAHGGLDCGHRSFLAASPPTFRLINGAVGQQLGYALLPVGSPTSLLPDTRAAHDQGAWRLPHDLPVGEQFRIVGIGTADLQTLPFRLQEPALPTTYQVPLRGPRGEVANPDEAVVYNGTCLIGPKTQLDPLHRRNGDISFQFEPAAAFGHLAPPTNSFPQEDFGGIPNDLLLHYLSSVGKLTNQEFGDALQSIHDDRRLACPTHYPTPTTADRQAALRLFSQLGFGDYDSLAGTIQVLPPALLRLPIAGNAARRMLLTGARTPQLLRQLREAADSLGIQVTINSQYDGQTIAENLTGLTPSLREATTQPFRLLLPDRVELLAHGSPAQLYGDQQLKALATQCGIQFCGDIVQANLLNFSGSLRDYHQALVEYTEELPPDWKQSWFDPQTLRWQPGTGDRSSFCLVEFEYRVYRRQCFLWQNGKPYVVDKSWGRYLVLQHANKQVLYYNRRDQVLKVPAAVPFPELPARAIALLSGFAPTLEWNESEKRRYNVYQTGNTHNLLYNRLPSVLGQQIREIY
ncbi:hypothetical protein Q5H92_20130 [Hymenobacter sp. M29]|uniref:Uncharacterized protein n=1 Tax=Hymenobacter mellowenesis TaxID=3063995 RepID=A0ABT9AFP1_9BACT|nr:hypothetical protein [Hymenobacter sp. M29]MDO7848685.1 hypothetical protein [Hymenobacter sp. M29]